MLSKNLARLMGPFERWLPWRARRGLRMWGIHADPPRGQIEL